MFVLEKGDILMRGLSRIGLMFAGILLMLCLIFSGGCATFGKKKVPDFPTVALANICSHVDTNQMICECHQDNFSCQADRNVYACVILKYLNKENTISFEWYSPDNNLYYRSDPEQLSKDKELREMSMAFQRLDITKMADLNLTGVWRLVIKLNGEPLKELPFRVIP